MVKALITLGLIATVSLRAQSGPDPGKAGAVTFTATLRSRVYVWDWFQASTPYQNEYGYSGNLLRLNFAEKYGSADFDEEIAVPFLLGLPNHATAPAPQGALGLGSNYYTANGGHQYAAMPFIKQLYGRYRFGDKGPQSIQAGRFEFNDSTELTPKN